MTIRPNHTRFHAVLPDHLLEALDQVAAHHRVHRSHLIQAAVHHYLQVPQARASRKEILRAAAKAREHQLELGLEPATPGVPTPPAEPGDAGVAGEAVQGEARAGGGWPAVRSTRRGWADISRTLGRQG